MALTGRAFPSRHLNPTWAAVAPPPLPPGEVGLATGAGGVTAPAPVVVAFAGLAVGSGVVLDVSGPQSIAVAHPGIAQGFGFVQGQVPRAPRFIAVGAGQVAAPAALIVGAAPAVSGVGSIPATWGVVVAEAGIAQGSGLVSDVAIPGGPISWQDGTPIAWESGELIGWT